MDTLIRPVRETDYDTLAALNNAIWPDYPETADEIRQEDAHRSPKIRWARFLAEQGGEPIARFGYSQSEWMFHPRRFEFGIDVLPQWEGQGLEARLYEHLREQVMPLDPLSLRVHVREDKPAQLQFFGERGFVEDMREQESRLYLGAFDPQVWAADVERATKEGIEIQSFAALSAVDPDIFPRIYELEWELDQDVPAPEPPTKPEYDNWLKRRQDDPNFVPDGFFVAVDGGEYVGISNVYTAQASKETLYTGITGIKRSHRKRGIATALKVFALSYAKRSGALYVKTWNEMNNTGMLGINFRLGFVRTPAWITLVKKIKEDASDEPAAL